jgi:hypothetical protein
MWQAIRSSDSRSLIFGKQFPDSGMIVNHSLHNRTPCCRILRKIVFVVDLGSDRAGCGGYRNNLTDVMGRLYFLLNINRLLVLIVKANCCVTPLGFNLEAREWKIQTSTHGCNLGKVWRPRSFSTFLKSLADLSRRGPVVGRRPWGRSVNGSCRLDTVSTKESCRLTSD